QRNYFYSSRKQHTKSVSAFLLNRSSHLSSVPTTLPTIQRINIIGSREGSRNRRRLKANQTGKKFRVGIKSNISTNRNNLISGVRSEERRVGKDERTRSQIVIHAIINCQQ